MPVLSDIPNEILLAPQQVTRSTESRLNSAAAGRQGLNQLLKEDEPRSYERAIVKGCHDGNAPFNQKRLNQDGQRWRCNLNFRGLEGTIDSARIPYYALFSGVPQYAVFKTRFRATEAISARWNAIVGEKFTCMLDGWRQFKWHIQAREFQMLFEGWGPLIFDNDSTFRFKSVPARSFLVPQNSPSCLDDRIPYFVVRDELRVHQLYKMIKDKKKSDAAETRGWNVKAVQNAIKNGTKGSSGDHMSWQNQPWEEWQKRYKDKTLISSYTECDIIKCAHLYVLEYTGKVSHFIITESTVAGDTTEGSDDWFLFQDINKYDSFDQIANVAFQNTGDGTWHSVRGIGLKSYGYEEVQNRLNCRIVDNAQLASMIFLQGSNPKSDQKVQLMVAGAVAHVPPGTDFLDRRIGTDIASVMGVTRMLENKLANKIGAFNQRSITREDGRGEKATATEIEAAASKEGSLNSAQIDNYYMDLDGLYTEVYRRALIVSDPLAKRFVQDCLDAGVPREAMEDMEYVRANRKSGYGSPQMRKLAMQELMQIYPTLPEDGKKNALNEMISSLFGPDKIEVFNPPMEEISQDEWMADIENRSLHEGEEPKITSGMDHVAHLKIHLDDAEQRLAPIQQAIEQDQEVDPAALQDAYQYVSALADHCEAHLAFLESDPAHQQIAKYFEGQLRIITAFHGKLRSAVKSAQARAAQEQRAQQQAVQLDAITQAKVQREQLGMQLDVQKAQTDSQLKVKKTVDATNLKRWQAGRKNELDVAKTAEQIRQDRIKTLADVRNKSLNKGKTNGSKEK